MLVCKVSLHETHDPIFITHHIKKESYERKLHLVMRKLLQITAPGPLCHLIQHLNLRLTANTSRIPPRVSKSEQIPISFCSEWSELNNIICQQHHHYYLDILDIVDLMDLMINTYSKYLITVIEKNYNCLIINIIIIIWWSST